MVDSSPKAINVVDGSRQRQVKRQTGQSWHFNEALAAEDWRFPKSWGIPKMRKMLGFMDDNWGYPHSRNPPICILIIQISTISTGFIGEFWYDEGNGMGIVVKMGHCV
jgi:hypothetical protein